MWPNIENPNFFFLERLFCSEAWRMWLRKFLRWDFYQIWPSCRQKWGFRLFYQRATKTWDWNLEVRPNCPNFIIFLLGETFLLQKLTKVVRKVSLQKFLPILVVLPPKMGIRYFWQACDKNLALVFGGATKLSKILNFLTWRDFFAPEFDESGAESLPPGTFTNFGRSTSKNGDSVFFTSVRQKPEIAFWRCDQIVQNL